MRSSLHLLPFSLLPFLTSSFPLLPIRPRASYSVVAVDGGPTPSPAAPLTTTTSLQTLTRTQTLLSTQLSTVVVTEGATPTALVVTITNALPTTIVETVTNVAEAPTVTVTNVSVAVSEATVMATATETVLPETRPYDDGKWHTTYWYTVSTPEASAVATATVTEIVAAAAAATSTQAVDTNVNTNVNAGVDTPQDSAPADTPGAWTPPTGADDGSWDRWSGATGGWQGPTK